MNEERAFLLAFDISTDLEIHYKYDKLDRELEIDRVLMLSPGGSVDVTNALDHDAIYEGIREVRQWAYDDYDEGVYDADNRP